MNENVKPIWNSLEVIKILVSSLTPILIFFLGFYVNDMNKKQQLLHEIDTENQRRAESESATDRDTTKEYIRLMSSNEACSTESTITLLLKFATSAHSENLKQDFLERCKDKADNFKVLELAVENATTLSVLNGLILDLKTEKRYEARKKLKNMFSSNANQVSDKFVDAINADAANYRTGLGILSVLADPDARNSASEELKKSLSILGKSSNMKDLTYKKLYEEAVNNQAQ